jgi:hypothetical protein
VAGSGVLPDVSGVDVPCGSDIGVSKASTVDVLVGSATVEVRVGTGVSATGIAVGGGGGVSVGVLPALSVGKGATGEGVGRFVGSQPHTSKARPRAKSRMDAARFIQR